MIEQDHLRVYDIILKTKSPLFIGNGRSYAKTEYMFNPNTFEVGMLDEHAFFQLLISRGLSDQYEQFIMSNSRDKRLYRFLNKDCGLSKQEIDGITKYTLYAGYALDDAHSLKEIYSFYRDNSGRAYAPGSSLKGALRTILLQQKILNDGGGSKIERDSIPEGKYLHTLHCRMDRNTGSPKNDPVNSIMRGISISDSAIISDSDFTISTKIDTDLHGNENAINLCRECVKPGVHIHFKLTLDNSVLHNTITPDTIMAAVQAYGHYYEQAYVSHFQRPLDDSGEMFQNCLVLGGGAGFFSKTLAYPFLGWEQGLRYVSDKLDNQFRRNNRAKNGKSDLTVGISPRMLKYTEYHKQLYPFGVCEVQIQ